MPYIIVYKDKPGFAPWHCFGFFWMHEDGTQVRCSAGPITQPLLSRILLSVSVRPSVFRVSIPNFIRAIAFKLAPLRGRPQKACLMLKFIRSADGNRPPFLRYITTPTLAHSSPFNLTLNRPLAISLWCLSTRQQDEWARLKNAVRMRVFIAIEIIRDNKTN